MLNFILKIDNHYLLLKYLGLKSLYQDDEYGTLRAFYDAEKREWLPRFIFCLI